MINAATLPKTGSSLLAIGTAIASPKGEGAPFDLMALLLPTRDGAAGEVTVADPTPGKARQHPAGSGKRLPAGAREADDAAAGDLVAGLGDETALAEPGAQDVGSADDPLRWLAGLAVMAPLQPASAKPAVATTMATASRVKAEQTAIPGSFHALDDAVPPAALGSTAPVLAASPSDAGASRATLVTTYATPFDPMGTADQFSLPVAARSESTPPAPIDPADATLVSDASVRPVLAAAIGLSQPLTTKPVSPAPIQPVADRMAIDALPDAPRPASLLDAPAAPIVRVEPASTSSTGSAPGTATVTTAAQLFGDAFRPALRDRSDTADPTLTALTGAASPAAHLHAVAPAQQGALDMRADTWPRAMIERIDALRDAANAMDTSIRLHPDALGTIDVSLRKEGDAVHVNLSAEQAATRQLLADAQPRLTQLAEERGLKLAQTSVDAGTGGQFADARQQPRAPLPHQPAAPTSAGTASTEADDDHSTRIA